MLTCDNYSLPTSLTEALNIWSRSPKGSLIVSGATDILQAAKFDIIIFETVGVGQIEIDVVEKVDTVVLTLVPESGDDIQMMKAGIIEIADIFVICEDNASLKVFKQITLNFSII